LKHTYRTLHFFGGIGGKALGFAHAMAAHGDATATLETIGSIDNDPLACRDFESLIGAPTLCADVHDLEPADLIRFVGEHAPDLVAMSPPCKGLSGLLSEKKAAEAKYQKMNTLMLRALLLVSATWSTPPKLIFVENVPRMSSRGADVVAKSVAILEAHGYAVTIGTHDCGELGGLAQHRQRWFLLARHRASMPNFVYQPPKLRVRACGEVLGPLPMPGDLLAGGAMHSLPNLSWRNWLRLAHIPAGGDWRDLPGTLGANEKRREKFRRQPVTPWDGPADTVTGPGGSSSTNVADPRFGHVDRVTPWSVPVGAITSSPAPSSGAGAVADPRLPLGCEPRSGAYGVVGWDDAAKLVTGSLSVDNGPASVADPRIAIAPSEGRHWNKYAVTDWQDPAHTITGTDTRVGSGAPSVADPRWGGGRFGITPWAEPSGTVAGESLPNNGKFSVADPRFVGGKKKNWQQVAGVTPWTSPAPTVTSGAKIHAGAFQVADPRVSANARYRILTLAEAMELDLDPDRPAPFIPLIIAADGTWHRPLTTLELAVLQSFPATIDGVPLVLTGKSHTRWRLGIGNAVPPAAALAVGNQLVRALLLATLGAFTLSNDEIWVSPAQEAMAV
jgi:site-specific DNA-cytosine methylase